jgi:hypothetical protein
MVEQAVGERVRQYWPNRSLIEAGVLIATGTDWPGIPNPEVSWDARTDHAAESREYIRRRTMARAGDRVAVALCDSGLHAEFRALWAWRPSLALLRPRSHMLTETRM